MSFFPNGLLDPFRRKLGKSFRKRLGVYHYKIGHTQYHAKPGVIPLHLKERLKKKDTHYHRMLLKKLERESDYPLGTLNSGHFKLDANKLPFFDVPDLTGFELKPYVSVHTPKVEQAILEKVRRLNDFNLAENFGRFQKEKKLVDLSTKEAKVE